MFLTSDFSKQLAGDAGIVDLMRDLGEAININPEILFLGGGNPARIAEFEAHIAHQLRDIAGDSEALHRLIGVYQSPRGCERFISHLVNYLTEQSWPVTERNVCVTGGSQSAFFMLINLLAGPSGSSKAKKICLPLIPEYLGYADQGLARDMFYSVKPKIELIGDFGFKYQIDFEQLRQADSYAAMCVSRPTNPSANMIADDELNQLGDLAAAKSIPLIVDCAYGQPFPGLVYGQHTTKWQPNRIYVLSLSKLGLPGARTGIVIADESIIAALEKSNTVISLANGNFGPTLMSSLIESGSLAPLCKQVLLPFYERKRALALAAIHQSFAGLEYRVHNSDGAFFLWLWFPKLRISSTELYQRLKHRDVLVMDGSHFFFEHKDSWPHAKQCIRLSYCAEDEVIERAIAIMAEELRALV